MKSTIFYTSLALLFLVACTSKIDFDPTPPVVIVPSADTSNLIISEISTAINTDGGTYRNHYVELNNVGNSTADLSNYAVGYFATTDTGTLSDFDFPPDFYITLNNVLYTGKCYVIASSQCDAVKVKSDTTWGSTSANANIPLQLSGNSAIALLKKDTAGVYKLGVIHYKIVDVFGSPKVARVISQGKTSTRNNFMWTIAGETKDTRNRTFFRKSTIKKPTANWDSARGTDAINSQWILSGDKAWNYTNIGLPTP
jgi:hypothetical protein